LSDFSLFRQNGFEVAWCSGIEGSGDDCPLLRNEDCPLLAGADVVLQPISSPAIIPPMKRRHPEVTLVRVTGETTEGSRTSWSSGPSPDWVLSSSDDVDAQVWALRHAVMEKQLCKPGQDIIDESIMEFVAGPCR
jgi:hypothetical protein